MATARIVEEKTGNVIEYYIEDRLKNSLDKKVIPSLHTKDKDFIVCVDGKEGCLYKDTLIKTSKGNIKIQDLNNGQPFFVNSLDLKTNKSKVNKAICIKTGNKELFEIETIDGRKVKATKDHTFFVLRNKKVYEVKLSNLKEGDKLICK